MTKHVNADSIIRGNFCDIVKFFRGRDLDAVDRLAQRALNIILRTDHLVQTGNEIDTDPFTANMFANAALTSINRTLKTYPFVRESDEAAEADKDAVFAAAEKQIESAERLSPDRDVISTLYSLSNRRFLVLTDGFKNDEAGYERAMAASAARWLPPDISAELALAMGERRLYPQFDHPALKIPRS